MGKITRGTVFQQGQTADAVQINAEFDRIHAVLNGGIDSTNLAAGAFNASSLAANSVANDKLSAGIDARKVGGGNVSNEEYDYLNGLTSNVQAQIDALESDSVAESLSSFRNGSVRAFSFNYPKLVFNQLGRGKNLYGGEREPFGYLPFSAPSGQKLYLIMLQWHYIAQSGSGSYVPGVYVESKDFPASSSANPGYLTDSSTPVFGMYNSGPSASYITYLENVTIYMVLDIRT